MLDVTETLLEMHFHRAFVALFEEVFGAKFLRLLKPSTRTEAWVGFDQGWVRTTVSNQDLMRELREYVQGTLPRPRLVLGYFMQFKVVHEKKRSSRTDPPDVSPPYFRSKLSLAASKTTGISQHETLLRIAELPGADVTYCCPFLFDVEDIYEPPDLDQIKVVDVSTAPPGWATGGEHFIVFQDEVSAPPLWCSEPVEGKGMSGREWVVAKAKREETVEQVLGMLSSSAEIGSGEVHRSFTLLELTDDL